MSIFKGDRVYRSDGTAVGFRRHNTYEVVDVSRTHIKVRNDQGETSRWFERSDFMFIAPGNIRRVTHYMIVYKDAQGAIDTKFKHSAFGARIVADQLRQDGYTILATKKVTIPYQEIV